MNWQRCEKVVSRTVDNETILIDPFSGRFWILNDTGRWIWEALATPVSEQAVIDGILKSCKDVPAAAEDEVLDFLHRLEEIRVAEQTSTSADTSLSRQELDGPYLSPRITYNDDLQAAAGLCESGHSGGAFCRVPSSCAHLYQ